MESDSVLRLNRPERYTARILWALAKLMLGSEVKGRAALTEEEPRAGEVPHESSWLKGLQFLASYVREPRLRVLSATGVPTLIEPVPLVFRRAEENLVRIGTLQARGDDVPASLWGPLTGWQSDDFVAIGLLRARQARREGRTEDAEREYHKLFEQAKEQGPDFLLDVVVAERSVHHTPRLLRGRR